MTPWKAARATGGSNWFADRGWTAALVLAACCAIAGCRGKPRDAPGTSGQPRNAANHPAPPVNVRGDRSGSGGSQDGTGAGQAASGAGQASAGESPAPDLLSRTKAVYKALSSYADTGTVVEEFPGVVTHSAFKTFYRSKSRDLYFDFTKLYQDDPKPNGLRLDFKDKRIVWWMRSGDLEQYNFEGKLHESFPPTSNQATALNNSLTYGASILIPSLLYPKANMPSAILEIEESTEAGIEDVDGHPCQKIIAVAAAYYPNGRRTGVRPVSVWYDRETLLIRKVLEDTPKSYGADSYKRITFTIRPEANPTIDDSKFHFDIPAPQQ